MERELFKEQPKMHTSRDRQNNAPPKNVHIVIPGPVKCDVPQRSGTMLKMNLWR